MCPTHQISCEQEMCLKCHLYCVLIFSFMPPNLVIGNVPEMSCVLATGYVPEISTVLATGNLPEILPYTVPGNVKEKSKFPGVGNVHTINRKCELSCTFHEISWPRKFRISYSDYSYKNRPFNYNPCKLANKHNGNYKQLQITTLNRHKTLSTAKDFFHFSHRNEKYLIVGLSLDHGRCMMAWKAEQQP